MDVISLSSQNAASFDESEPRPPTLSCIPHQREDDHYKLINYDARVLRPSVNCSRELSLPTNDFKMMSIKAIATILVCLFAWEGGAQEQVLFKDHELIVKQVAIVGTMPSSPGSLYSN